MAIGHAVAALVGVAFALLALATALSWLRARDQGRGYLALAIVLFAVLPGLAQVQQALQLQAAGLFTELMLLAFIGSGYALLRFRDFYLPLTGSRRTLAQAATGMAVLASLPVAFATRSAPPVLLGLGGAVIGATWLVSVLDPVLRLWLASRALAPVQKARLRALSYGYGGLALVLAIDTAGVRILSQGWAAVAVQVVVLATVPLLYLSFSPPAWVRRQWRAPVEEEVRAALDHLLDAELDRAALADRTLGSALRLAGAQSGFVLDSDRTLLAVRGLSAATAAALGEELAPKMPSLERIDVIGHGAETAMVLPLRTGSGVGAFVLFGGPFTPAFAGDELSRLEQYVVTVAAILASAGTRGQLLDEHRRLEEAYAHLESANEHKSVFLASMSHELRTPLNAIIGFSELLIDDVDGNFDPATRLQFISQVRTSGQQLLALINDILDLSKVEAGQMELHLEPVDLAEVVAGVQETVAPLVRTQRQTMLANVRPGLQLQADRGKLRQMLLNLVSNAIKFTPEEGHITIRAAKKLGWIAISVTDTGIGIAEADQDRVFEEFRQLDSGRARQHSGTGLGLALTRRFVELHGGEISVKSAPGSGSTFTLRLPMAPARAEEMIATLPEAEVDLERPLVLVVEDDPPAAELLLRHLERGGFSSVVARSGREALSLAKELPVVAITLDILMPDLDGWDVLADLRRDARTRDIPVVVVSIVDNPELGRALGATDFLVKPVDGQVLLAKLRRYLGVSGIPRGSRVLAIDDEAANLDLLKAMLAPEGIKVLCAGGGAEGVRMARERQPALVLLDLVMPDVDGFAVVEALRADPLTFDIPILVLTSKDLTQRDKAQLSGRVAAIFNRNSTAGADLIEWLNRAITVEVA